MWPHGANLRLEENRIDSGSEIVIGDELQDAAPTFRHLGPL
jgi:hypothetical protein